MTAPCKNCKDRKMACHSKCEKYLAFKEDNEKFRQSMKEDRFYGSNKTRRS